MTDKIKNGNIENIFLITIDCLRADYIGKKNGDTITPNIDRFLKKCYNFVNAFSNGPGTNQSFPSIFTSTYFLMNEGLRLCPKNKTIAEVLRNNGFKTIAFHSNPFLSKILGWNRGFDEFYDFLSELNSPSSFITKFSTTNFSYITKVFKRIFGERIYDKFTHFCKKIFYKFTQYKIPYIDGRKLNIKIFKHLDMIDEQKLFCWIHYMDPHEPYAPPIPFLSNFKNRSEAIKYNIINENNVNMAIDKNNMMEKSLIILTSDHGNAFLEHNKMAHSYDILYNEVIRVPLIIYGLGDARTLYNYVDLLSIGPTILNEINIKPPNTFLGKSLKEIIHDDEDRIIYSHSAKPDLINLTYDYRKYIISCILKPHKYIMNNIYGFNELYNIENDPLESNNLIDKFPILEKELQKMINIHIKNYLKF